MSRRIAILTGVGIRFYDIKEVDPPYTIVGEQLYRTDEDYMLSDETRPDEFCIYDKNGLYPYNIQNPPDPDDTMCYLDVLKSRKVKLGKATHKLKWLNRTNVMYAIIGCIIIYYLYKHYLVG